MRKCPYCGTENKDNSKKCKKCRYSLDTDYNDVSDTRRKLGRILPVIILLLLFAAIIVVGLIANITRFQAFRRW